MDLAQFKFSPEQLQFIEAELQRLSRISQPSQNEQLILSLINNIQNQNCTQQQRNTFDRVMKHEFKKYKARLELDKLKLSEKKILTDLKKHNQTEQIQQRKKREHTLISIGALFEMVQFPTQDRGIITGILLSIMQQFKDHPNSIEQFKIIGDRFIHQREQQKKAKATLVNTSKTQVSSSA